MSWSTPDAEPADPVLGDPASVAALAGAMSRIARDLDAALEAVTLARESTAAAPEPRVPSRRHAGRLRAVCSDGAALSTTLDHTARHLADHAADLASAQGLANRIVERARSTGLDVDGAQVVRPRGVHGVADPQAEDARHSALPRLQRVLDAVLLDLDTRRGLLRADLARERQPRASR